MGARVWNGFREELGSGAVPIVDQGSAGKNQLHSGKLYATELVDGCQAINVEYGGTADDDTSFCDVGPSNSCFNATNIHRNNEIFEYYGYDPLMPDDLKPPNATNKTFAWYKEFGVDYHSAYEGIILKG